MQLCKLKCSRFWQILSRSTVGKPPTAHWCCYHKAAGLSSLEILYCRRYSWPPACCAARNTVGPSTTMSGSTSTPPTATTASALLRLQRDLKEVRSCPLPTGITVCEPEADNLFKWRVEMRPTDGKFKGQQVRQGDVTADGPLFRIYPHCLPPAAPFASLCCTVRSRWMWSSPRTTPVHPPRYHVRACYSTHASGGSTGGPWGPPACVLLHPVTYTLKRYDYTDA